VTASANPLGRALGFLKGRFFDPEYPLLAVEVRPRALGVVRLNRNGASVRLGAAASVDLPPGLLELSVTKANIADSKSFARVLVSVLERAGALLHGPVALVLPDPVARLALLPVGDLPARRGRDYLELVRFRLRKTVPFEVREAMVETLGAPGRDTVLAAALFLPVLESYETVLREVGLEPGLVELSSLSLLAGRPAGEETGDQLLVNWDEGYASLLLTRDGWPLLIRTLTDAAAAPDALGREVANTILYYRERLAGTILTGAVVRSAAIPPEDAVALLREPLGLTPEILDPWASLGGGDRLAAQALAGAVSSAVRSARRAA
jgi:hypothetical protein